MTPHDFFHRTCVDLVDTAAEGRLPTIYSRDKEAYEVLSLLRARRSVLLCGQPGVGKTAIINRVAALLAEERTRDSLRIFSVTTAQIIATAQGYIGQWQSQLHSVLDGVRAEEGVLYYCDIWLSLGAGRTSNSEDNVWDAMAPLVERQELTLLCECQPEVVRTLQRRAPGMLDRFFRLDVRPLDDEQTLAVLLSHARKISEGLPMEERWGEDATRRVREVTDRFQPYRAQPGKGIALMDRVVHYRREKLRRGEDEPITPYLVERVFSVYSGLPLFVLSDQEPLSRNQAFLFFKEHIVGQEQAIAPLVEAIALYKAGLNDPRRPIASFLFVGPTGVGKTELARTLARYLFGSPDRLLRLDMSEYRDFHGYQVLVGDPARPDERALLCDPMREQPFQVVLLDEFEKGHPNIADLLLQVLDAGRLTTPRGEVIDFTNAILILTSNLGADLRKGLVGLRPDRESERGHLIEGALRDVLRPEFLNRLDRVVQFRSLSADDLRLVARRELQLISSRPGIRGRRVTLDVDDQVLDKIVAEEVDPKQGARGLRRALERRVAVPVALALIERPRGDWERGATERLRVRLDASKGVVVEIFGDDDEQGAGPGSGQGPGQARGKRHSKVSGAPPERVLLSGDDTRLRMTPAQALLRLTELRQVLTALCSFYGLDARRVELEQMAQEHARPGFWSDAARATREFARYNRLSFQVRRLERLDDRLTELEQQAEDLRRDAAGAGTGAGGRRRVPLIDAIAETAERVEEADLELRRFCLEGEDDEADALLRLLPEVDGHGHAEPEALKAAAQLWEMYAGWAGQGPRRAELLYAPAAGGIETPMLVGVVTGPLAFGYLRREAGQHRFRLRRGGPDGPGHAVLIRAQVYPVLMEGEAPLAPREVLQQAYALKLTVDDAHGLQRRVRSAVLSHTADGHALAVQNERDLAENRLLLRRLHAAVDAFPAGGRAPTDDPLVRTYEMAGQPLIKDNATGYVSGRARDILGGDLDEMLRLRVRQIDLGPQP
jgi:ATP-dependent Clp protease ATP-binding subunit ClpA/protein subunit release factor A